MTWVPLASDPDELVPCPLATGRELELMYNHMVVDLLDERRTDELFHALADATRRDILKRAIDGDHSVSALANAYPMSFAAVQKHVAVLERAGLVTKRRSGRRQLVKTDIETVRTASGLLDEIEEIWRQRIDQLDETLAEPVEGESDARQEH